jgi:toxin CptA
VIKPIEIRLHLSRLLVSTLAVAYLLALGIAWGLKLDLTMQLGLSAIILINAAWSFRRLLNPDIVALKVNVKDGFFVLDRGGDWRPASVQGSSFVAPYLTLLHLKLHAERRLRYLVIMPDAVATEDFRKLRVWLKWRES